MPTVNTALKDTELAGGIAILLLTFDGGSGLGLNGEKERGRWLLALRDLLTWVYQPGNATIWDTCEVFGFNFPKHTSKKVLVLLLRDILGHTRILARGYELAFGSR